MRVLVFFFFLIAMTFEYSSAAEDNCNQPLDQGLCRGYFPSYGYDTSTNKCVPFIYGGCGGNSNRYATIEKCQAACEN